MSLAILVYIEDYKLIYQAINGWREDMVSDLIGFYCSFIVVLKCMMLNEIRFCFISDHKGIRQASESLLLV